MRMDRLRQLGERLDVIEIALAVAREEPEPEHRGRMLGALNAATEATRAEHSEAENTEEKRSSLRLIRGGEVLAAASPAERWTSRSLDPAERSAG